MKYTEEMILQSDSGYCMPFEEQQGKDVELSLGYGEQTDPVTGEKFFHHGIDFNVRCYMLSALASGIVSGVGNDSGHGICQTIRYGEYEVTYGNLSNVFAQFGQRVKAGQTVALSGDKLHMTVRFKGEELNPLEFLTMLYGNIQAMRQAGGHETDYPSGVEMELGTDYDRDKREIEELMLRFLPHYMEDLRHGAYTLPRNTEQSLRHIFTVGAMKEYFYENMPSMANPLGLGHKAMPLACKVQNLLIADFLHYLALRHDGILRYIIVEPQMSMFFIASGFLFSEKLDWRTFFSKKFKRLMIPYVSFWCIMQFTHSVLAGFTRSGGYDIADEIVALFTGGHYWFLYDLLLVMITTRLFRSFKGGLILLATIAVICRLSISDMPTNMWRYFLYTPFFIAGIYMRRNYSVIRKFVSEYRLPIFAVSLVGFVLAYMFEEKEMFIGRMAGVVLFVTMCYTILYDFNGDQTDCRQLPI